MSLNESFTISAIGKKYLLFAHQRKLKKKKKKRKKKNNAEEAKKKTKVSVVVNPPLANSKGRGLLPF